MAVTAAVITGAIVTTDYWSENDGLGVRLSGFGDSAGVKACSEDSDQATGEYGLVLSFYKLMSRR